MTFLSVPDQGHSQTGGDGGDRSGNPTETAGSRGIVPEEVTLKSPPWQLLVLSTFFLISVPVTEVHSTLQKLPQLVISTPRISPEPF